MTSIVLTIVELFVALESVLIPHYNAWSLLLPLNVEGRAYCPEEVELFESLELVHLQLPVTLVYYLPHCVIVLLHQFHIFMRLL